MLIILKYTRISQIFLILCFTLLLNRENVYCEPSPSSNGGYVTDYRIFRKISAFIKEGRKKIIKLVDAQGKTSEYDTNDKNNKWVPIITKSFGNEIFHVHISLGQQEHIQTIDGKILDRIRLIKGDIFDSSVNQIFKEGSLKTYYMMKVKKVPSNDYKDDEFEFYDPELVDNLEDKKALEQAILDFVNGKIILVESAIPVNVLNKVMKYKNCVKKYSQFFNFIEYYNFIKKSTKSGLTKYILKEKYINDNRHAVVMKYKKGSISLSNIKIRRDKLERNVNLECRCDSVIIHSAQDDTGETQIYNISLNVKQEATNEVITALELIKKGYQVFITLNIKDKNNVEKAKVSFETLKQYLEFEVNKNSGDENSQILLRDKAAEKGKFSLFSLKGSTLKYCGDQSIKILKEANEDYMVYANYETINNSELDVDKSVFNLSLDTSNTLPSTIGVLDRLIKSVYNINAKVILKDQANKILSKINFREFMENFMIKQAKGDKVPTLEIKNAKSDHIKFFRVSSDSFLGIRDLKWSDIFNYYKNCKYQTSHSSIDSTNKSDKKEEIYNITLKLTNRMQRDLHEALKLRKKQKPIPITAKTGEKNKSITVDLTELLKYYYLKKLTEKSIYSLVDKAIDNDNLTIFEIDYKANQLKFSRYIEQVCLKGDCGKKTKLIVICIISTLGVIGIIAGIGLKVWWDKTHSDENDAPRAPQNTPLRQNHVPFQNNDSTQGNALGNQNQNQYLNPAIGLNDVVHPHPNIGLQVVQPQEGRNVEEERYL